MKLANERYTGHPMVSHFDIENISRKVFEQWLKLFADAIDEVYIPDRE